MTKKALEEENKKLKRELKFLREQNYLNEQVHKEEISKLNLEHKEILKNISLEHRQILLENEKQITNLNNIITSQAEECEDIKKKLEEQKKLTQNCLMEKEKLRMQLEKLKQKASKNSTNSSIPTSKEIITPKKKKIANNREKTNKKIGGQIGHKGITLSKEDVLDKLKNKVYSHEVVNHGDVKKKKYKSRYEVEIEFNVKIIEHRYYEGEKIPLKHSTPVTYGPELKTFCSVLNVEGCMSLNKISNIIKEMTKGKITISEGSIVNFNRVLAKKFENNIEELKKKTLLAELLHVDDTSIRVAKQMYHILTHVTKEGIYLVPIEKKNMDCINETEILPNYLGTIIQDHETKYYNYGKEHGECNIHILRYLRKDLEDSKNKWCQKMIDLLIEMKGYKNECVVKGISKISDEEYTKYANKYDELIEQGYKENSLMPQGPFKEEDKKLLNRMKKYQANHLLFIKDFKVPFTNNAAELSIRHAKVKQKISGEFKNKDTLKDYLNIKSIILTSKIHKENYYQKIRKAYQAA